MICVCDVRGATAGRRGAAGNVMERMFLRPGIEPAGAEGRPRPVAIEGERKIPPHRLWPGVKLTRA